MAGKCPCRGSCGNETGSNAGILAGKMIIRGHQIILDPRSGAATMCARCAGRSHQGATTSAMPSIRFQPLRNFVQET